MFSLAPLHRFAPAVALTAALLLPGLAAASADKWQIDHGTSVLGFEGVAFGGSIEGQFKTWSGDIAFDPAELGTSSASITIDMTSVDTGDNTRDATIKGSAWFNTGEFPKASFTAGTFREVEDGTYEADGVLTIRGVTKEVTLPFTFEEANGVATVAGALEVDRTDFGIGQGEFMTGEVVGKTVTITLAISAKRLPEDL